MATFSDVISKIPSAFWAFSQTIWREKEGVQIFGVRWGIFMAVKMGKVWHFASHFFTFCAISIASKTFLPLPSSTDFLSVIKPFCN